jgi:TRAP-type C4-dicarboxylate transport system substrate-binding protein
VLKLANSFAHLIPEPAVAYFARRIDELSRGTVHVAVVNLADDGQADFEQRMVRDIAADRADLGWVGTRVFDTIGVTSFQALTAPMLIDNYPLEKAVIASDIPRRMLTALDGLHVTGLAILADGLRKPIGSDHPLLGPADWRGNVFQVFRSHGQTKAMSVLGARPTEVRFGEMASGGAESNLRQYIYTAGFLPFPYVTANVNLWPQTIALLANPDRLAQLDDEQRGWLRQAAQDAAASSTNMFDHEAEIVAAACRNGARFADASQEDLSALRRAFDPIYVSLERDQQTEGFIKSIEALKASTPAGPAIVIPSGCTGSAFQATTDSPLVGWWETGHITGDQWIHAFIAAGGAEKEAHEWWGSKRYLVVTLRFDRTFTEFEGVDDKAPEQGASATYRVVDDHTLIMADLSEQCDSCEGTFRYDIRGATLRLYFVGHSSGHDAPYGIALFGSFPFTRTRGIPGRP